MWYLDLHHVPGGRDAVRLGVGDVARQRRPVILVRDTTRLYVRVYTSIKLE